MEFDDEDGLDEPAAPLLPPDDRLWRHPSEVRGNGETEPRTLPGREPRTMTVAALSSAVSVLLTVGLIAAVGPLRVERVAETRVAPASDATPAAGPAVDVSRLADQVRPALVRLNIVTSSGTVSGSAVIIRSDGVMLSAAHLVSGASALRGTLADGSERMVRVVGLDEEIDLAVLDLDGEGFATAVLGSAVRLRAGEPAITVGAPGDVGGATVTAGVIGGLGRAVDHGGRTYLDMIQIDRPIAPGCAGGAVLDAKGSLIALAGVNVQREGAVLGYAIPIDVAKLSAEQLLATGKVSRVWLGIEGEDLGPRRSQELALDGGVMVKRVKPDSPAARAGIRPGQVILAVNAEPVPTMAALVLALRAHQPGVEVSVDVLDGQERRQLKVLLTERPTVAS